MSRDTEPLPALRAGGKAALARALARIEAAPREEATLALLDAAWAAPRAVVIGLTGPPGVGKSTLASALVRANSPATGSMSTATTWRPLRAASSSPM